MGLCALWLTKKIFFFFWLIKFLGELIEKKYFFWLIKIFLGDLIKFFEVEKGVWGVLSLITKLFISKKKFFFFWFVCDSK